MRVLKEIKSTGELKVVKYPRHDIGVITNLDKDIEFYIIQESLPVYNNDTQYINLTGYTLTDISHNDYPHLKVAQKVYDIIDIVNIPDPTEERIKEIEGLIEVLAKDKNERTATEETKLSDFIDKKKLLSIKTL